MLVSFFFSAQIFFDTYHSTEVERDRVFWVEFALWSPQSRRPFRLNIRATFCKTPKYFEIIDSMIYPHGYTSVYRTLLILDSSFKYSAYCKRVAWRIRRSFVLSKLLLSQRRVTQLLPQQNNYVKQIRRLHPAPEYHFRHGQSSLANAGSAQPL